MVGAGDLEELGIGRARAQHGDADAGAAQFIGERLAEARHEGFASEVHRHARPGLKPRNGRNQHDAAPPARHHAGRDQARQLGQRDDVDLQDFADAAEIHAVEAAKRA